MDVASFAVMFLHRYENNQDTWPQDKKNVSSRYREKIEERLGREIGPGDATPGSRKAALLEYDIRQLILADPYFGGELRQVVMMEPGFAVSLQSRELCQASLVNEPDPRQPASPYPQRIVVAVIGVLVLFALCFVLGKLS